MHNQSESNSDLEVHVLTKIIAMVMVHVLPFKQICNKKNQH